MDSQIAGLDWEILSDSSSSEDEEDIDFSYGGQARSILSSLEESIEKIDDLLSFERTFFYGDVVSSLSDPSGQMGKVVSVDMFLDLENVQGNILKNVNSKKLVKIRSISGGDYVIKGPWLGQVQRVVDKVTVLFDDGAKCEILALEKEKLIPLTHIFFEDSQYSYYPGQRVRVKSSPAFKSARWPCGTWRDNQDEGTISAVEAGLVNVKWFASVLFGSNVNVNAPPCWQDSKNLTLLSCFSHANWNLGDWCMLPVLEQKQHMVQHASACDLSAEHSVARRHRTNNFSSNIKELFLIVKIKTKVDILWQNGEHAMGLDPQNLIPVNVINTHDFWPQQYVLEKGASDDPLQPSSKKWGVVLSVDAKERTVMVHWKTVHVSEPDNLAKDTMVEIVSAYELVEHPDYSYLLGDTVFKAQKQLDSQADENYAKSVTDLNVDAFVRDQDEISYENKVSDDYYLSSVGNVVGFRDGGVEVKWATGLTTKVAPYEIFQIDKPEDSAEVPFSYERNFEGFSHEMLEHGSFPSDQKGKELLNCENGRGSHEKHSGECSSFSLPQAVFECFSSIKASIFKTLGMASDSGAARPIPTIEEGKDTDFADKKDLKTCGPYAESHTVNVSQPIEDQTPYEEFVKIGRNDFPVSSDSNSSGQLKQFDIINNCPDHHFYGEGKELALSQVKRDWVKKVQQEWSILEENLPETIYVRVFEERMDLMRAAIVGASGTPYHDGLFFFDICFPPQYPSEPPMVHYNSGGLRLNPNLYESGKVCLSLLNTWTGTASEVWNPRASTVLQVLLSLQALVLNEKPYFNEAGYDNQIGRAEGEKNSLSYNENAFLVTCKSMLYLLRKSPLHFEALVEEHFRRRSQHILSACKAYLEGAPIGYAFESGKVVDENQKGTSTGFKIMLAKLFPKLAEAFSDKGIDCRQFIELQK